MPITTLTSRAFNQDTSAAKRATKRGPVVITDRGKPAHVLLTVEDYRKLTDKAENIVELLAFPGAETIDVEDVRLGEAFRPAKFS